MTPEGSAHLCGDLAKWGNRLEAISLLGSEKFLKALKEKDKSLLPNSTDVQWYLENFPVSWGNGERK